MGASRLDQQIGWGRAELASGEDSCRLSKGLAAWHSLVAIDEPEDRKTKFLDPYVNGIPLNKSIQGRNCLGALAINRCLKDVPMSGLGEFQKGKDQLAVRPENASRILHIQV